MTMMGIVLAKVGRRKRPNQGRRPARCFIETRLQMKSRFVAAILVSLLTPLVLCSGQAPPTIEETLSREGVGLSNEALLASLKSPKAEVRGMAAVLLAQRGYKSAIPAMNAALEEESDPTGRLNLASALDRLGQHSGLSALETLCNDQTLPADLRMNAAKKSLAHGGGTCAAAATEVLSASDNPASQLSALNYFLDGRLPASTMEAYSSDLIKGMHRALDSEVAAVRRGSAECIGRFKLSSERSHLLTVMRMESDSNAKAAMQKAVDELANP